MKTIATPNGTVTLMAPPAELLREVREYLPFGVARFAKPQHGADFGLVMQCGEKEVYAIKQQYPDSNEEYGELWYGAFVALITSSLASYVRNGSGGLLMPCAYKKVKEGGQMEAGIAYFGHASPSASVISKDEDESKDFAEQFGAGFFAMIKQFIQCLVESAARTGIPIQEVIIGMDVRKRSQLGTIGFGFLVVGPHIVCIKAQIREDDPVWDFLAKSGVKEVYHMPSLPIGIGEEMLATTKPGG